ncbi:GNAT family N-acetyltransferase [Belnapia sp. T6]|uniref:GNAT family N-acetyltransferase n=1 Tax=Belnapia mucosa TaxID=2804532 RepID=A0ABS1V9S5_9PROT|nr:GNAT family N-acetyltransferase [Belnapia mucosa]MBL6458107.1 GNAT family N-acetyltransferase [Belnapia mucosa]
MSDGIAIRPLEEADMPALPGLLAQLGYAMPAEEVARRVAAVRAAPGHAVLVAVREGAVLGLMHLFLRPAIEKPPEAMVQALVVEAGSRGTGLGRRLMAAAEDWARAQGQASLALTSNSARSGAHAFYTTLGYETVATSVLFRKAL